MNFFEDAIGGEKEKLTPKCDVISENSSIT